MATEWSMHHQQGTYWIFALLALLFLPPIVAFVYNVSRDPATPTVLKNGAALIQERSMGFLSARKTAGGEKRN